MKVDTKTDTIFAIWPGMTDEDSINEVCQLGKFTYFRKDLGNGLFTHIGTFYRLRGYAIMEELVSKDRMDILAKTKIISNRGKEYTLEKFLNSLTGFNVK